MAILLGNSYLKTSWTVGLPITQLKMNNIEDGIAAIDTLTRDIVPAVNGNTNNISQLTSNVDHNTNDISIIQLNITNINNNIELGRYGGTQVRDMVNKHEDGTPSETLGGAVSRMISAAVLAEANLRSDAIDTEADSRSREDTEIKRRLGLVETTNSNLSDAIAIAEGNITTIQQEISDARGNLTYRASRKANSLLEKIEDITWKIDDTTSIVSTVDGKIRATYENTLYASLAERLNGIDTVGAEVVAARGKDSSGNDNTALIQHFLLNETLIGNNTTAIENLNTDKISYSDLITNLTTNNNNKPLAASQGRELRNIIGGSFASTTGNTVKDGIDAAEQNAKDYTDSLLGDSNFNNTTNTVAAAIAAAQLNATNYTDELLGENVFDSTHTVADRLDAIDNVSTGTIHGLDVRVTANEDAITTLNGNASTAGSVLNTVTNKIAEVIADAPEAFDTLLEIAAWIGENSDDALTMQLNISTLDTRLTAIDNSTNGRMKEAEDDIDALETTIGASDASGLRKRIADLETEMDNAAVASEVNARLNGIDGGTVITGTSLKDKVNALENKNTSYTEVVSTLPTQNIDATKDYLVGPTNGKYYYYKYINNNWELISGASNGGGGNSSAVILSELPNAANADLNTDYYIGTGTSGYIHYRYITIDNTKTPIIIGGNKYNITTGKEGTTTYLYLFLFALDENSELTDESDIEALISAGKLVRKVPLPEGGSGGGTSTSSYHAITRLIGDTEYIISTEDTKSVLIKLFFLAYQEQDGDNVKKNGTFTLKRGGLIINSGRIYSADLTITEESPEYENSWWSYNIGPYCSKGINNFTLTIEVGDLAPRVREWSIEVIELTIDSNININTTYNVNLDLPIAVTIGGRTDTARTIYALVDGRTESNAITDIIPAGDNSETVNLTIPAAYIATVGAHNIELYFKLIIGANTLPSISNRISYDIACIDSNNNDTIILTSPYRLSGIEMKLYEALRVPYNIYIPSLYTELLYMKITNSITGKTLTQPITSGTFTYLFKALEKNIQTITFDCVNDSNESVLTNPMVITATISNSEYAINPITGTNLVFDFNPALGYSNNVSNEEDRLWTYNYSDGTEETTYHLTTEEGFDWENGGWKTDEEDIPYFCVKAGSRATIDTSLFTGITEGTGAEFKCIFKAVNVRNPEAVFLTSIDNTKSVITNYESDMAAEDLDMEKPKSLFANFINVKEGHVISINTKKDPTDNEYLTDKLDVTVLPNNNDINFEDFDSLLLAALTKRFKKNTSTTISNIKDIRDAADTATKAVLVKLFPDDILAWYAKADTKVVNDLTIYYYVKAKTNDLKQRLALLANPLNTNNIISNYYLGEENNEYTNAPTTTTDFTQAERELLADYIWVKENGEYTFNEFDLHITTDEYLALYDTELDGGLKKELLYEFHSEVIVKENLPTNTISDINHLISDRNNTETRLISYRLDGEEKDTEVEVEISYTTTTVTVNDEQVVTKHYQQITLIRPIAERIEQGRGLELRAHRSNLYLDNGTLTYPYSEEDIIEFEYNIYPVDEAKYTSCILTYEEGVPSASILYPKGVNALVQNDPQNLIIGSDDCDIYIYRMKFYNRKLNNDEILLNFCADALEPTEMTSRYVRNRNTYTTDKQPDTITPLSIANACPDLRVIMIEAPKLTEGKNSFIKNTSIRCIYKGGRPEDNWIAYNAYHAGQGTSSDAYGASGRNLDIIFAFNGVDSVIAPKAKNNYRFDSEYKSILVTGVLDNNNAIPSLDTQYLNPIVSQINNKKPSGTPDITKEDLNNNNYYPEDLDYYPYDNLKVYFQGQGKINLTDESVLNNWFNIKLNIASSENTNNALLQKRFDRYLPYRDQVPAMKRDPNVKNDMEFFNCVVFIRETSNNRVEFDDNDWHFYGLGNIGDSKKTDNTRVNIPEDPAEFCVEISDNGLINSGFSTGVYYNTAADAEAEKTYSEVSNVSFVDKGYGYIYPISEELWDNANNEARKTITLYAEGGGWEKSFEFRYDVSTKDGNTISNNDVAKKLATRRQEHNKEIFAQMYKWVATSTDSNFKNHLKDWFIEDSPLYWYLFTERYTMIDSRAKNTFWHYGKVYLTDAEYLIDSLTNKTQAVMNAETLYTSKLNIYNALLENNEATTELINAAQLDMLEAKTNLEIAEFIQNNRENFMHNKYTNGVGTPLKDRYGKDLDCNALGLINNGYRFEMWDYDNDTALGINNNGKMVFEAGLEDIDRAANSWIYNEGPSVFWRRIRKNMTSELATLYTDLKDDCFNALNLINEFDEWQALFPENLWRIDFERKYYRPYNKGGEISYLRDMANGRKKYQRREFENNMCIYINSKYVPTAAYNPDDFIHFRPVNPLNIYLSRVIKITPYSTMYINLSIGNDENSRKESVRTLAGVSREFDISEAVSAVVDLQNIQCKIYNASRIQEITGLENYYPDQVSLTAGKKLRKITLGTDYVRDSNNKIIYVDGNGERIPNPIDGSAPTGGTPIPYINTNTTSENFELGTDETTNPVLEELDLRNCLRINGTFNLQGCISLTKLYAQGTQLTYVILPNGGLVRELYLPSTTTTLNFQNLKLLTTLNILSYANINSVTINNTPNIDTLNILNRTINNLSIVKVNGINWKNITSLDIIKQIYDKRIDSSAPDNFILSGNIKLSNTATYKTLELEDYRRAWQGLLTIDVSEATEIKLYLVKFVYDDETAAVKGLNNLTRIIYLYYATEVDSATGAMLTYMDNGLPKALDPVYLKWVLYEDITRPMTDSLMFTFGEYTTAYVPFSGWKLSNNTTPNMSTNFKGTLTLYTVFYAETRQYKFRWFMDRKEGSTPVAESGNINYGEGANTVNAPTVLLLLLKNPPVPTYSIEDNTIKIFKGWSHLPLNITPENLNIYAEWQEYNMNTTFGDNIDLSTLNPGQLVELLDNDTALRKINKSATMDIQLGYEGAMTGTLLIIPDDDGNFLTVNENKYVACQNTNILATDQEFTLAIDFKCTVNDTSLSSVNQGESIIASCYSEDNGTCTGFKLFYSLSNKCLYISFGDTKGQNLVSNTIQLTSRDNDESFNRDIIVLRHIKNSPTLYVYYGTKATGGLSTTILKANITLGAYTPCNRNLIFGAITYSNGSARDDIAAGQSSPEVTKGRANIYWAKLWKTDLGEDECMKLANWCHERMTFGVVLTSLTQENTLNINTQLDVLPKLYLSSLSCSTMGTYKLGPFSDDEVGWFNSPYKTMLNQRVFNALPILLLAIAFSTTIISRHAAKVNNGNWYTSYAIASSNDYIRGDYVAVPALREISNNYNSTYAVEASNRLPWSSSGSMTILQYNTDNNSFENTNGSDDYKRLRFKGTPLVQDATVYIFDRSLINNTLYNFITTNHTLKTGDIWYPQNETTAYMYVDSTVVGNGALINENASSIFSCGKYGGWVPAVAWWTRSFTHNQQQEHSNFIYVSAKGQIATEPNSTESCGIDYSIGF